MPRGKVHVSPFFDMLEGTRALEIENKSLDTGIIPLLDSEINFDCSQGRSLPEVAAVMNYLLRSFVGWVNGNSLLVTVLSCRYMYDLLCNFKKTNKVSETDFVNRCLHPHPYTPDSSEESDYVNIVLRGFTISFAKILSFFLKISLDVLYEEEDITTRAMDLSFFCATPYEDVYQPLEAAIEYLKDESTVPGHKQAMLHLELAKRLLKLSDTMTKTILLFEESAPVDVSYIKEAVEILDQLKSESFVDVPELLVSRFVQVDANNRHIPSPNDVVEKEEALNKLSEILLSISQIPAVFTSLENSSQLLCYLKHDVGLNMARSANALVRGFFQLFFIRDDRSIAGLDQSISTFAIQCMESLCLVNNSIMDTELWVIEGTSDVGTVKNECIDKISRFLDELDSAFYQRLSVFGSNRCRQRQLLTRNLVIWDSLQFSSENMEVDLFRYGIGDKIIQSESPDQPALALSSYIYYVKLSMMTEVVLSGFEHDLYQPSEAHMMYWYAGELYAHMHQHLLGRLRDINTNKLAWINNITKRAKKAKGAKRDSLRAQHQRLVTEAVPILTVNMALIETHLMPTAVTMYYLCRAVSMAIQLLRCILGPEKVFLPLKNEEKMYRLRMKPWSSIGTPEVPSYSRFLESNNISETLANLTGEARNREMLKIANNIERELESVKLSSEKVLTNFNTNELLKSRLHFGENKHMNDWFNGIHSTCESYLQELKGVHKFFEGNGYRLQTKGGGCVYFPIYHLTSKQL